MEEGGHVDVGDGLVQAACHAVDARLRRRQPLARRQLACTQGGPGPGGRALGAGGGVLRPRCPGAQRQPCKQRAGTHSRCTATRPCSHAAASRQLAASRYAPLVSWRSRRSNWLQMALFTRTDSSWRAWRSVGVSRNGTSSRTPDLLACACAHPEPEAAPLPGRLAPRPPLLRLLLAAGGPSAVADSGAAVPPRRRLRVLRAQDRVPLPSRPYFFSTLRSSCTSAAWLFLTGGDALPRPRLAAAVRASSSAAAAAAAVAVEVSGAAACRAGSAARPTSLQRGAIGESVGLARGKLQALACARRHAKWHKGLLACNPYQTRRLQATSMNVA